MKYLLSLLILTVVGCTSNNTEEVGKLKHDLRFTSDQLESCQNSLSVYRNSGSSSSGFNQEETVQDDTPTEPQYETVEAFKLISKPGETTCYQHEVEPCGMTFYECKDGYVYRCMQDAKYKVIEEKRLVTE